LADDKLERDCYQKKASEYDIFFDKKWLPKNG
jgi:hypothetical protein